MNKILFIVNEYYPLKNANTVCVERVINELVNNDHEVHVLCYMDEHKDFSIDKVCIHGIKLDYYVSTINFPRIKKESSIGRFFYLVRLLFTYPIYHPEVGKLLSQSAKIIIEKFNIDTVVAVVNPIESLVPLTTIKKQNMHYIIYELDSITDLDNRNSGFRKLLNRKRRVFEKKVYSIADKIIHMKCHARHFDSICYDKFRSKMELADFPLYDTNATNNVRVCFHDPVRLIFTGTLLEGIRNPKEAINILSILSLKCEIVMDFFSRGDYEDYLNKRAKLINGLNCNGYVAEDRLNTAIDKADILISIGNNMPNMMPSKIYSYISLRKPIIHFYCIEDDPCINILAGYPLALLVDQKHDENNNANIIYNYISKINNTNVSLDDRELFMLNTPDYTSEIIID